MYFRVNKAVVHMDDQEIKVVQCLKSRIRLLALSIGAGACMYINVMLVAQFGGLHDTP